MSGSTLPAHRGRRTAVAAPAASQVPTLSFDSLEHETEEQLLVRGAAYVREYDAIKTKETTLLKNIATVLVGIRQRCVDQDGRTDWQGRTHRYRQLAADLYSRSGIQLGSDSPIQAAVRYHIGNILREVVPPAELAQFNLKVQSPVERNQEARQARAAIVAMARHELTAAQSGAEQPKAKKQSKEAASAPAPAPAGALVGDHIRLGAGARSILEQLSTDVIDGMTDGQRARLDDELTKIQKRVAELRRHARKRSSGT
nr:hypothetical protein OG513_07775 [Streptomyces sp. NBC_00998]